MKRLLCIVGSMDAGGAETFLMKIYRKLDRQKYQMDFAVAVPDKGFYDEEILAMGGHIYHIVPKSKGLLKNFFSIKNLVKGERYQYVLRTSQHSLSALELLAAKLGGAKVCIFRSSNTNTTTGSEKELFLHRICMFMPRLFANVKIAPSTEAAEYMFGKNCLKKGAKIIHNGVDPAIYRYSEEGRQEIRKEFGIDAGTKVLGHIGRLTKQKNHEFLLKVFYEYKNREPSSKLLLVGIGELKADIVSKAEELGVLNDIIFAGVRGDIPKLLSAMDIFVFPSLYEGMPNTVIEAQFCSLFCVLSDEITKEAAISQNIKYLGITDPVIWANEVALHINRQSEADISTEYKIEYVVAEFVNCIFKEE